MTSVLVGLDLHVRYVAYSVLGWILIMLGEEFTKFCRVEWSALALAVLQLV